MSHRPALRRPARRLRRLGLVCAAVAVAGLSACLPADAGHDVGVVANQLPAGNLRLGEHAWLVPTVQVSGEATDVTVRVGIPAGLDIVAASPNAEVMDPATGASVDLAARCTNDRRTATCTFVGTVPAGAVIDRLEVAVEVVATAPGSHAVVNTVSTRGTEGQAASLPNEVSQSVTVTP